jgi:hypothetical protein
LFLFFLFFFGLFCPFVSFLSRVVCARRKKDFEKKKTNFDLEETSSHCETGVAFIFEGPSFFTSLKVQSFFVASFFLRLSFYSSSSKGQQHHIKRAILLSKDQEDQEEDQEDQEDGEPGSGGDAERAAGEERERGAFARGGVGVDCDF